jgi:isopentenyl-diphosphate delta-isomerase
MGSPVPTGYSAFSLLSIAIFAIPAFWISRRWLGWTGACSLWVMLGLYAVIIETLALTTGFPYGSFAYSDLLGPKLMGTTPIVVAIAWTPVILGAYAVAAQFSRDRFIRAASAALTAAAVDMALDPAAARIGLWTYDHSGGFYNVPWTNFAGWVVTCFFGALIVEMFSRRSILPVPIKLISSALLITLFWAVADAAGGLWLAAIVGSIMLVVMVVCWIHYSYEFDMMIVLASAAGEPIATLPKPQVHTASTPVHLAFSVFVFDEGGRLLIQQRAWTKKTWPGVWSNSCCGHLMPYETAAAAVRRRLKYELGLQGTEVIEMIPDFRYQAEKDGIVENEICPVFVVRCRQTPRPRATEVAAVQWLEWDEFLSDIRQSDSAMSPWAILEGELLERNPRFREWRNPSRRRTGGTAAFAEPI